MPTWRIKLGVAAILLLDGLAPADTVKLVSRPAFDQVTITDFRVDRLVFRGVSGEFLRKPLAEVESLRLDAYPEFSAAERAAARGDWDAALPAYATALTLASEPWLRNLVHRRYLAASERAGQFDRAIDLYAAWLEAKDVAGGLQAPSTPGRPGCQMNAAARARLEAALERKLSAQASEALQALLIEIRLYDELEPLPEAVDSVGGASQPADLPPGPRRRGILPAAEEPLAESRPAEAIPTIRLRSDSLVLKAARSAFEAHDLTRATRLLESARPYVDSGDRYPWQLLLARCRIATGQAAAAVAALSELVSTDPDPAHAATARCYVALAHERLGQADEAVAIYADLLGQTETPADIRAEARSALRRLRP